MDKVNRKIIKAEKQRKKQELSDGEEGAYPGSPLKSKEINIPGSIPDVHDSGDKRKEKEDTEPKEKTGKTEKNRVKLKRKLPDYRPSMVRTKKTSSFRNMRGELPTERGQGKFGPY